MILGMNHGYLYSAVIVIARFVISVVYLPLYVSFFLDEDWTDCVVACRQVYDKLIARLRAFQS